MKRIAPCSIRRLFLSMAITAVLLLTATGASASVFKSGDSISISNLHVIDDDLFVFASERFDLDGTIDGDLMAMVFRTTIRGQVLNSACVASQSLKHQGAIDGSLRAIAKDVEIDGTIGRSTEIYAIDVVKLGPGSVIERDANIAGGRVYLEGTVKGNATIAAGQVFITGQIEKDAKIESDHITVSPSAIVSGNLTYTSENEDALEISTGADIHGETIWRKLEESEDSGVTGWALRISSMLAALIFGIIVVRLFRPYAEESFIQIKTRYVTAFASGLMGLLVLALCVLLLALSVFSLGVAVGIMSTDSVLILGVLFLVFSTVAMPISAFATVAGAIIYYCGNILVGFLVGNLILRRMKSEAKSLTATSLLVGLVVLAILFSLPYLGDLLCLVGALAGAGGIIMGIRRCRRSKVNDREITPLPES